MTVIRTPFDRTGAEYVEMSEEGGTFWKMLIPMNHELDYKGRHIKFDRSYLANVRDSYKANALGDQVAFQLADDDNSHDTDEDRKSGRNYSPERYRGEVTDLKVVNSGLWGKYNLTKDGIKLINDNPKLGVSVSLKEDYERDGQKYPVVMRHVLGTLAPKIKGMPPWQRDEVKLSMPDEEDEEVLDFTMPATKDDEETVEVPKSTLDEIKNFMSEQKKFNTALTEALADDDDDDDDDGTVDQSDKDDEDDPRFVQMSEKMAEQDKRLLEADNRHASASFERKADSLARQGVPRSLIDLARPVMSVASVGEIQLSDGKTKADPQEVIGKMLEASKGFIDMSEEQGHSVKTDEEKEEDEKIDAISHDFMTGEF